MFVVVSYDVSDDRRRNRLRRALKDFGVRAQYSVFECTLAPGDVKRLEAAVRREIGDGDHVRFYYLCGHCARRAEAIGGAIGRPARTTVV